MLEKELARLASRWMHISGASLKMRDRLHMVDSAVRADTSPEQRTLMAAACDLADLLATTPEGRNALDDLGFKPLTQDGKGK